MFDTGDVLYAATVWRRRLLRLLSHMGLHTHYQDLTSYGSVITWWTSTAAGARIRTPSGRSYNRPVSRRARSTK